mmetsp:Transcript_22568/g.29297  ORF Transcript_22568/g.29297 Transcript_22568/m.29297 type:complete len:295 (-) Transcript_22568:233-1117(-)
MDSFTLIRYRVFLIFHYNSKHPKKTLYLKSTDSSIQYEKTWSNPSGTTLTNLAENIWAAERPFIWNSIDVGGRMTVIRLSDGSLWVHSPVALDSALSTALQELGPVKHIISPNYEHVKYAADWIEAYPEATSYACPGLQELKPDINFDTSVGDQKNSNPWGDEIEALWIDCEQNPFNGKPFFNEVVFFHRPSKSLLVTDLYWNYPGGDDIPVGTKLWKFGMDCIYLPFYNFFMITDSELFSRYIDIICAWGFESIIPCHGDLVTAAKEDDPEFKFRFHFSFSYIYRRLLSKLKI